MNLKQIIRFGLIAAVWGVVAALMTVFGVINVFWGVPAAVSWLIIGLGGVGTAVLLNQSTWEQLYTNVIYELEEKITEELQKMNRKDMVEMADGLRQLKDKFGIELDLPLSEKQKNDLDAMLSRLSDEELAIVQTRLQNGSLSEEDLADWLQAHHKLTR